MRIYLDACSLQRPFDDRTHPRIKVEAEVVLTILSLVETSDLELFSSEALQFEIAATPDPQRQEQAREILMLASQTVMLVDAIEAQAATFVKAGIKPMDALHLASASWAKAAYFCTTDDRLLKKSRKLKGLPARVVSPLQLIGEVSP